MIKIFALQMLRQINSFFPQIQPIIRLKEVFTWRDGSYIGVQT